MSDTYIGTCQECGLETDCIEGLCGECVDLPPLSKKELDYYMSLPDKSLKIPKGMMQPATGVLKACLCEKCCESHVPVEKLRRMRVCVHYVCQKCGDIESWYPGKTKCSRLTNSK